jgi:deoxyribose-phosphate aldolase
MLPPPASGDVAAIIDHTLLAPDASKADIERLCAEGVDHGFAAVCVNPYWVAVCERLAASRGIAVCAVVGFPLGASVAAVKAAEAERALADGAGEIDMVLNIGALKSRQLAAVADDIAAVTAICRNRGALCKVILETGLLTDEETVAACVLAQLTGADYVKTSTGFGPRGATTADVALMRQAVGRTLGIKASGGVRDLAALRAMVAAGATRIGTSAGVRIVQEWRGVGASPAPSGY